MKTFTNLNQFKKQLTVGDKIACVYIRGGQRIDRGVREVGLVQSKLFALKREDGKLSYCDYSKASECKIVDNKLIILEKDLKQFKDGLMADGNPDYDNLPIIPVLEYWFVD